MSHKYITCTGFGGTGSSVISDLMKEFSNVKSCGSDFEMSLAFDIGGISDLQHYLVDDFERHKITEGIYIFKRYIRIIQKGYCQFLGNDFIEIMDDYLRKIVLMEWNGENHMQHFRYGAFWRWFYYCLLPRTQNKIRKFLLMSDGYEHTAYLKKKLPMQLTVEESVFFEETRKMFSTILNLLDKNNQYEYLCFDQLVPPYNFDRYLKYFTNLKVVVIDRDPRDLYLLNKVYWKEAWIPSENVNNYIKWFLGLRRTLQEDLVANSKNVLFVKFEDTIYKYNDTIDKIIHSLEIDPNNHIEKQKYFNPERSMRNTKLWDRFPQYQKDISEIEKELNIFCYKYGFNL